jgi:putative tricarboxylic transport membrane protein
MPKVDRWLGTCLTLVALVWLWLVHIDIPDIRTEVEPGPRGFPRLLGVVLAILGVILVARSIMRSRPATPRRNTADAEGSAPVTRREVAFAGGVFALLISYAFLLERVGFLIATPVIMASAMVGLLRMRTWISIGLLAVGVTFGCWFIFDSLLGTPLPRGTWMPSL